MNSTPPKPPQSEPGDNVHQGSSWAMTMATELVVAPLIGFGMGYGLDAWLGTTPWFKAVFFVFGVIAGFLNVLRAANPELFPARPPKTTGPTPPEKQPNP